MDANSCQWVGYSSHYVGLECTSRHHHVFSCTAISRGRLQLFPSTFLVFRHLVRPRTLRRRSGAEAPLTGSWMTKPEAHVGCKGRYEHCNSERSSGEYGARPSLLRERARLLLRVGYLWVPCRMSLIWQEFVQTPTSTAGFLSEVLQKCHIAIFYLASNLTVTTR